MTSNRSRIFHRDPRREPAMAAAGSGPFIVDAAGKSYLDASGGAAVSCLGHHELRVIEAIKRQLDRLPYAHTSFFTSEPAEALAAHLIERAPPGIGHAFFVSGGSEATETAMKLARQYFVERGEPERRHFIARRQSYHGNTLGALSVGGNAARRRLHEPILLAASHVAPCYAYRHRRETETQEAYGLRVADELDAEIRRLGPGTVIAFIAETVSGATLGAATPVPGYLERIRSICDRHGVLLILDEVMCGMGRTGSLHACDRYGVAPDIITCAKGLGAGYMPIGACLISGEIHDTIVAGSGAFQHGFTYVGHAAACAGALAVQQVIEEDGLLENCRAMGSLLREALSQRFCDRPWFGDLRGEGLLLGLELVADRETKAPHDPALALHARIKAAAMEEGLMVYPGGGCADGVAGDHVLLAPPFIIDESHVGQIVERLDRAITVALASA